MSEFTEYLLNKQRMLQFSWRRVAYLFIAITALVTSEYMTRIYRQFIYQNHISDFGLADTAGNLFGVIALIYFFLFLIHADWKLSLFGISTQITGVILYEFIQPIFPWGTFDAKDILATFIGGGMAFTLNLGLHRMQFYSKCK